MNMALDAVLTERVGAGQAAATLWIWGGMPRASCSGGSSPCATRSTGRAGRELGIGFVRRITGGGEMYIQPEGAITYSLSRRNRSSRG